MPTFYRWSNQHKQMIKNAEKTTGVKIATGSGDSSSITCDVINLLTENYDLVVSFQVNLSCFVVWSTTLNRSLSRTHFHAGKSKELSNIIQSSIKEDEIKPFYTETRHNNLTLGYQKILFVGINKLQEVVENYENYIFPNPDDNGYRQPVYAPNENGDWEFVSTSDVPQTLINANISRSKDKIDRIRRDYKFRKLVLERWNNQCAVCGEKEIIVLQAAHVIAVKDGGNDEPRNGICLCANHHLMFDGENGKQLITISEDQKTFSCYSTSEKKKEWYIKAQERGLTLFPNND